LSLNWDEIALGRRELSHLDVVFSEEEVEAVVQELASDKALGLMASLQYF
jgi:hypothetical protein